MNEGNFSNNSSQKAYYGIDGDGRLFRTPSQQEIDNNDKNIVHHTLTKGTKAGQVVLRKVLPYIYGKVSALWIKSSEDYGDSLILELHESGFTSVLQMPMDSSFADDLIRKIHNVKEGVSYQVQSWKMQATDDNKRPIPDKWVRGISVKDSVGNKIERYINKERQLQLVPLEKTPLYDKESKNQTKDFWKIYFKLVENAFKTRVIPFAQNRFKVWADANIDNSQQEPQPIQQSNPTPKTGTEPLVNMKPSDTAQDSFPTMANAPVQELQPIEDDLPF